MLSKLFFIVLINLIQPFSILRLYIRYFISLLNCFKFNTKKVVNNFQLLLHSFLNINILILTILRKINDLALEVIHPQNI